MWHWGWVLLPLIAGCGVRGGYSDTSDMQVLMRGAVGDQETILAKQQLMMDMMSNPDLPAWHAQREQMALAIGDRQFDQGFDRVFDSMTVALASLGCRVQNMERASGYITASIPELPPDQVQALRKESTRQYAAVKGYPADLVDKPDPFGDMYDIDTGRYMAGLTLSMVKQGPEVTKVKLRFDNVFYPPAVNEYYKLVWQAVDKQMFLDKGLD